MNGHIADFLVDADAISVGLRRSIFSDRFQDIGAWRAFLSARLNSTVAARLKAPLASWRVDSFHALFIAAWIHHPGKKMGRGRKWDGGNIPKVPPSHYLILIPMLARLAVAIRSD